MEQAASFGPDASNVPGNPHLDSVSVQRSCGKLQQDRNPNPVTCLKCGKKTNQQAIEIQLEKTRLDCQNLQVTNYEYVEKVFKNLGHKLSRSENDEMFDLKTYVLIWELLMSTTMNSAVHLGREYQQNLIACRNTNFEELKTLLDITLRLIVENSVGILNLSTMIYDFSFWMRSTLCHDQVIKWAKAKVQVHSNLCVRACGDCPVCWR